MKTITRLTTTMLGSALALGAAACGSATESTSSDQAEDLSASCNASADGYVVGTAAQSTGDPHMVSGDGLAFEDQSSGWHLELQSISATNKSTPTAWQLQVAADQYMCFPGVRCTRAVDVYVGGSRLHFWRSGAVAINGAGATISSPLALPMHVSVTHTPASASAPFDQYVITNAYGETVTLDVTSVTIDVYVNLSRARKSDRVGGILGCFDHDGDPTNDLCHRNKCTGSFDASDPNQVAAFLDEWRVLGDDDCDTSE